MKPTLKTALCSLSFVAVGAFAQTSTLPQVQVNPGFGNPLFDLTAMYAQTPHGDYAYYVTGHPENYTVLNDYGVNSNHITVDYWSNSYPMPILSLNFGNRQCVAAVRRLSNAKITSKWRAKEGDRLSPYMNRQTPFAVATFYGGEDNDGKKYGGSWRHTGIVFDYDSGGVWILDQNWGQKNNGPEVGRLTMRYMTYSGSYQNNAGNYYVIHQLP